MSYDLQLDDDGDLLLTDGDLTQNSGVTAIKQDIQARLQFWLGEWFLDQSIGLLDRELFFVKNPDFLAIQGAIRREIQNTPGVDEVTRCEVTYDATTRTLSVDWRATTDLGEIGEATEL